MFYDTEPMVEYLVLELVTENKDTDAAEYEMKATSLEWQSNLVTKLD